MTQQEVYENTVNVGLIPQAPKYQVQIKGHTFYLTRGEALKLYHKLLVLLPTENTACDTIKEAAAKMFGVSVRSINSPGRKSHVVLARHAAMWAARKMGISYTEIAEAFNKHHGSAMNGVKTFEEKMADEKIKLKAEKLEAHLKELIL